MKGGNMERVVERKGSEADKGVFLIVLVVCLPFCILAGIVAWMAG
jgi:cell division septal protein FtsQ